MQKDLLELRKQAEAQFNALKNSIDSINAEFKTYGLSTMEEALVELNRLQGEFRAFNKAIELAPKKQPKADVIDATPVDPETK